VPERREAPRTRARQRREDAANLELRRRAAWYTLAQVLEHFLHHEFKAIGLPAGERWRRAGARMARRVFRILCETRDGDARNRKRRLERAQVWARKKTVPGELVEYLVDKVTGLFREMEQDGDLDWRPSLEDARATMAASPSSRVVTDEQMCRQEWIRQKEKEHGEFEQRFQPIVEKVKAHLASAGLVGSQAGSYLAFVTAFTNAARSTRPGSDERRRALENQMILVKKWHDPALVERIRDLVLAEWDRPASA
jgi:hypothetical protein